MSTKTKHPFVFHLDFPYPVSVGKFPNGVKRNTIKLSNEKDFN